MPGSGGTPVTRSTLRQQIADALRDEVLAGRLQPGQEFTVKQIADQYGVSATPVREALVDLSAQGLLESDHHRGFRVHQFTVDDYRDMVETRSLVIDGIVQHARRAGRTRVNAATVAPVRRRAEEADRAARGGDLDILIGYDLRFWRELGTIVSNRYISDFLHQLRVQIWVFAMPHLRIEPEVRRWLFTGYEELVDALVSGEVDAAREVLCAYNDLSLSWAARLDERLSS
ncbi:GntR family transcriptional regulator [Streptomyces sp. NPDC094448]|uniref:GntR family transcriptional regulator n=1 Tax=Streptomyces sp. NPDC094448 TaxID=3366063 RepID=UPI003802B018